MDSVGSSWLPPQGSTVASEFDALFNFILSTGLIMLGIVTVSIVIFVIRYKRGAKAGLTSGKDHNLKMELLWTGIPIVLLMIVFVWGFRDFMTLSVAPPDAMEIRVKGQKWFWSFDYPEGINTVDKLVVPVNRPVKLILSSADVIHSFYVPGFRVKADALPNRYTSLWFEATTVGEFPVYCAEYCGQGHSAMLGLIQVVPDSSFAMWLDENASLGEGLSLEEYGRELFVTKACITCHVSQGPPGQGPNLQGRYNAEVLLSDGSRLIADENYLRESILNPRAKVVNGYQPIMPTFQGILKDRQIDALIEYIKSQGKK